MIFVCLVPQFAFKEQVTQYGSHCQEYASVAYPSGYKLFLYHASAFPDIIHNHSTFPIMTFGEALYWPFLYRGRVFDARPGFNDGSKRSRIN
jgi:hypothetical protein